jgi:hypothetical protein
MGAFLHLYIIHFFFYFALSNEFNIDLIIGHCISYIFFYFALCTFVAFRVPPPTPSLEGLIQRGRGV